MNFKLDEDVGKKVWELVALDCVGSDFLMATCRDSCLVCNPSHLV